MTNYVFEKHGVSWNTNLDKTKSVREHLRSPDGSYRAYDSLVPADVIGAVMKSEKATKAVVIVAYKGYKRFADSRMLTKHLKNIIHVIDRTESPAEIFKRFGAFSDKQWDKFRDNINKKHFGYWDSTNIFQRTNALEIIKKGDIEAPSTEKNPKKRKISSKESVTAAPGEVMDSLRKSESRVRELTRSLQNSDARVTQLVNLLRENGISIPPPPLVSSPVSNIASVPEGTIESSIPPSDNLLMSPAPLDNRTQNSQE